MTPHQAKACIKTEYIGDMCSKPFTKFFLFIFSVVLNEHCKTLLLLSQTLNLEVVSSNRVPRHTPDSVSERARVLLEEGFLLV